MSNTKYSELIKDLKKDDLLKLSSILKEYNNYIDIFWKNAKKEFWLNYLNKDKLVVQYFQDKNMNLDILKTYVIGIYKKHFDLNISDTNSIEFIENKSLEWWIRVFKNDNMIDISFLNIHKQLV